MKKFAVTVTRVDEYEIEIDENIHDETWLSEFRKAFYSFDSLEDVVESIAKYQARNGDEDGFIEGYGYVARDGELPYSSKDFDPKGNWLPEEQRRKPAPGLNIIVISEDEDIETEIEEIL